MAARSYIRKVGTNGIYNESDEFMAGQSMWFRGPQDKIPAGWLIENGAALSRTTYATLFAVIGVTYGAGDGATTFNLPDRRGEFDRGLDLGRGVDPGRVLGSAQGQSGRGVNADPSAMNVIGSTGIFQVFTQLNHFSKADWAEAEIRTRNLAGIPIIKYS